jgi:hypothetical protein
LTENNVALGVHMDHLSESRTYSVRLINKILTGTTCRIGPNRH